MMKILDKKWLKVLISIIVIAVINCCAIGIMNINRDSDLVFEYIVKGGTAETYQLFYSQDGIWDEEASSKVDYIDVGKQQLIQHHFSRTTQQIRLDVGWTDTEIEVSSIFIKYLWGKVNITERLLSETVSKQHIGAVERQDDTILVERTGSDPYLIIDIGDINFYESIDKIIFVLVLILLNSALVALFFIRRRIKEVLLKLSNNRRLIYNLAKNDFKTKYAGSYLGITWAFIQPIVTIVVYWFVFEFGLRATSPMVDVPFIMWFSAGLVPWFFFQEALMNATNCMTEYSYLVKKVVFKISILPLVKVLASVVIHIVFIGLLGVVVIGNGFSLSIYSIQIIYYAVCMISLVLALSYATSAIIVFFKDLGQLLNIILQIGMWMTPIMWSYTIMPANIRWILYLNPMTYVVEGYRDALINEIWFFEKMPPTLYFWGLIIILVGVGCTVFKKLKPHFADVL